MGLLAFVCEIVMSEENSNANFYDNEIHIQRLLKRKKKKNTKTGCKNYPTRTFTLTHIVCLHMFVNKFSYIIMILYKPLI